MQERGGWYKHTEDGEIKEEERQMGPDRRRESSRETKRAYKKKKKEKREQPGQKRATVVFRACCRLACHQLARGRCNWERWVIIATNLPLNTHASPLRASQRAGAARLLSGAPSAIPTGPKRDCGGLSPSQLSRRTQKDPLGVSTGVCGSAVGAPAPANSR